MTRTPFIRRVAIVVSGLCTMLMLLPVAGHAEPGEMGIEAELSEAIDAYVEAEDALRSAESRQDDLKDEIENSKETIKSLTGQVNDFAVAAYLNGGLPPATSILATGDPGSAVDALAVVSYLGDDSGAKLQELVEAEASLEAEELALEDEILAAEQALNDMEEARDAAARAIASDGRGASPGPQGGNARVPDAAPRGADGSWPYESCSMPDPTTNGLYHRPYGSRVDAGRHGRIHPLHRLLPVGGGRWRTSTWASLRLCVSCRWLPRLRHRRGQGLR